MSIWTTHNDIDILNLAGARHGDYILVKTGNKVLTKFQMPYVPRGEKFRIRILLPQEAIRTAPMRVTLTDKSVVTDGPHAVWLRPPTVRYPEAPKKKDTSSSSTS